MRSLWEEENFAKLDVELAVRQDLSASPVVATLKECHLQNETYTIVSEPCIGPTLRQQLQVSMLSRARCSRCTLFRILDR